MPLQRGLVGDIVSGNGGFRRREAQSEEELCETISLSGSAYSLQVL
jgi:hypothetical protein